MFMSISRRNFLSTSIVASTIGLNVNASSPKEDANCGIKSIKRFDPTNEPRRIRKSFYDLTDDELKNLCRAVGYMRGKIALNSTLQWESYAKLHAYHCTDAGITMSQVHWSWHFLPWHRGYIYFLERILDNILKTQFGYTGEPIAYPYWDWSNHQEIPNTKDRIAKKLSSPLFGYDLTQEDMVNADNLGFDNLALYDGNRGPTISKYQMDPKNEKSRDSKQHIVETKWYMSHPYVNAMLSAPFEMFGGKPITDKSTGQGLLEQGPHNDGHDWVGTRYGNNRNMGTLRYAANDPIFFMHHANIDRIWSLYRQRQPDPNGPWGKQEYTYTDIDGSPVTVSVKDIVTKMTNVTYQRPSDDPVGRSTSYILQTAPSIVTSVEIPINKKLDKTVTIKLNRSQLEKILLLNPKLTVLEIVTGPIEYTDKFNIRVYISNPQLQKNQYEYIGRFNTMDGRNKDRNVNISHSFVMPLYSPIGVNDKLSSIIGNSNDIELLLITNKSLQIDIKTLKLSVIT